MSYSQTKEQFENFVSASSFKNGITTKKITEDIYLFDFDLHIPQDNFNLQSEHPNLPKGLYINVMQNGKYAYDSEDIHLVGKENFTTISHYINPDVEREARFQNGTFKSLGLYVKGDFLKQHLEQLEERRDNTILQNKPTNPKTQMCVYDIFNSEFSGKFHELYVESKVLEILFNEFSDIHIDSNKLKNIILSEYDKHALYKARDILLKNMQNPPSVVSLAKLVKLNEFKLKKGFKTLFNTTPYAFLNKHRLEHAKKLLISSEMSVCEVAKNVGFKHQGYLTKRFLEVYGCTPKSLMKERSYYY